MEYTVPVSLGRNFCV